ncbi:MAG: hypothetical protein EBU96_01755 [Actinobacteria bacterium]|nr:hypothetical protein [Actinomycetota bacterium]
MAGTHRTESKSPGNKRAGKKRSADEIAAEIESTCLNITSNIASLEKLAKPAKFAARGLGSAGAFVLDKDGEIRRDRVITIAALGIGLFGLLTRSRKN